VYAATRAPVPSLCSESSTSAYPDLLFASKCMPVQPHQGIFLRRQYPGIIRSISVTAHLSTRSKDCPLTVPPPSDERTLRLKPSRFAFRSSAASLFSGSDAFGSRKRNYPLSATTLTAFCLVLNLPADQRPPHSSSAPASSLHAECSNTRCLPDRCSGGRSFVCT
jgi:hypothetical protein